jgi:hypothetical protein
MMYFMNKEIEHLIRQTAQGRLNFASEDRCTQGGQIMDDAKMITWMYALKLSPTDEDYMDRITNDQTLIEFCFDRLCEIYKNGNP